MPDSPPSGRSTPSDPSRAADPERVDSVAILDCGGQYTKVIDRKIRELGVRSEIFPLEVSPSELAGFDGIVLSGGPSSVWGAERPDCDPGVWELGVPVLGICYGMQLLNVHFGGVVSGGRSSEYGVTGLRVDPSSPLFDGLEPEQQVLMSHGDSVDELAPGFRVIAETEDAVGAIADEERRLYGVQFHPEVDLTEQGRRMLANFLSRICGLEGNYVLEDRIETAVARIRAVVGEHPVLVLVSGGVDSAVSAALLLKALGPERVFAVHVDHGLMRKDESDRICHVLRELGLEHLERIDGREMFFHDTVEVERGDGPGGGVEVLGPLTSLVDPEEKRRLIGEIFLKALREAALGLELDFDETYWAQGTLRPDLIESGNPTISGYAQKIKTHHNDIELVRRARAAGRVIETNWDWHKDEVRQVARMLGIPEEIAARQPFPGPGLAVRLIADHGAGGPTAEQARAVAEAVHEWNGAYAGTVVPVKTVGVQGDQRSYRHLALVAGPHGGKLEAADWEGLGRLGNRLANRFDYVNRTGYVLNHREIPPGIDHHPTYITEETVDLLRELDFIVTRHLTLETVSQAFAVLLPIGRDGAYSVAVRTFVTDDFMTGRPARVGAGGGPGEGAEVPLDALERIVREIDEGFADRIDLVVWDV
ncbi:MAG: glutamine-hydrolyzing GMP synthase, partial [Acidobacteriota bacterium]